MKRDYFSEPNAYDRHQQRVDKDGNSTPPAPRNPILPVDDPHDELCELGADLPVPVHDEELRQRVRLFLAGSHIPALRQVRVEIENDTVVLRGELGTFYEKQMAAQFASRVAGVIRVIDLIEVRAYVPLLRRPDRIRSVGA